MLLSGGTAASAAKEPEELTPRSKRNKKTVFMAGSMAAETLFSPSKVKRK
jgi:hypothetical protein